MSEMQYPISYNAIDINKLKMVLDRYEGRFHHQLITDFENELALRTGAGYVVALNSGTSAIHMALRVLGIGVGDVVIAPTFTYVATINPILYQGASPVFVDCETGTWNMDPDLLEIALKTEIEKGKRVKAILIVHTYGMPADMDRITKIAADYDVPVIEDAAEALGSIYKGKAAGTLGKIGVYSFNNNKVFTTYGGGALITQDEEIARKVRFMATQSRENLPYYEHKELGYNYLMGALNAAYGLCQLPDLEEKIALRRELFTTYSGCIINTQFQQQPEASYSNRWLSAIIFKDSEQKNLISRGLTYKGFETRPLWNPMHRQPLFGLFTYYGDTVSVALFEKGLCLPTGNYLSSTETKEIIDFVNGHVSLK